jgi:hypothetical protein
MAIYDYTPETTPWGGLSLGDTTGGRLRLSRMLRRCWFVGRGSDEQLATCFRRAISEARCDPWRESVAAVGVHPPILAISPFHLSVLISEI